MDLCYSVISLLAIILTPIIYIYYNYLSYWKNKNVPHIKTFGKFLDIYLYKKCPATVFDEIYKDPNSKNEAIVGINVFHRPGLVIRDPDLIKTILIKDFQYFQDRFSNANAHKDLLGSNNLFFKRNPQWKTIRTHLTPVFTSGKIKQMFSLANDIGKELDKHICTLTENNLKMTEQEVKGIAQLFTIDVIASIAYGIDAHSISNPNADFLRHGREVFHFTRWRSIEFSSFFFLPDILGLINAQVFTAKATQFLKSSILHIMAEREKSNLNRNDLIEALLALRKQQKNETDPSKVLDDITLVAQAATFFTAGFETSSTTMSFALWEICKHSEVQKRLREEIKSVLEQNNGELTYDVIQNMEYLNMVIQETLRLYPVLPFLDRLYSNPNGKDYSLQPYYKSSIANNTPVYIPIYSIHRDEKHFENPDKFIPERFSTKNKDKIKPYTYMPFGSGPRNCIGERFGLLQAKIGLVYFMKNHRIEVSDRTLREMKLEKKALLLQLEGGGVYCNLVRDPLIN